MLERYKMLHEKRKLQVEEEKRIELLKREKQKAEIKKIISSSSKYPETLEQNFHKIFKGQPGIETEDVVKNLRNFIKEVDKVCEKRLESYNSLIKDDVIRKSIDSIS